MIHVVGGQTEARAQLLSTIINYHEPFDQGLKVTVLQRRRYICELQFSIAIFSHESIFLGTLEETIIVTKNYCATRNIRVYANLV